MKKWALGIGALVSIASPIAVAVSCGDDDNNSVTKNLTDTQKTDLKTKLLAVNFAKNGTATQNVTGSSISNSIISTKMDKDVAAGKLVQDIVFIIHSATDVTWNNGITNHTFTKGTDIYVHSLETQKDGKSTWTLVLTNKDSVTSDADLVSGLIASLAPNNQTNIKAFTDAVSAIFS